MFHIFNEVVLSYVPHGKVLNTIHWHNTNILNGTKQVFEWYKISETLIQLDEINCKKGTAINDLDYLPPHSWFVSRLDFIVQMVQNDVIDKFIPCQNGCDFIELSLSHFDPFNKRLITFTKLAQILTNWKLPENFMLYLKLEFWFEYSSFFCACGVKLMERKKRKIVAFKCSSNHIFVHKKYILRKKFVAELLGFE